LVSCSRDGPLHRTRLREHNFGDNSLDEGQVKNTTRWRKVPLEPHICEGSSSDPQVSGSEQENAQESEACLGVVGGGWSNMRGTESDLMMPVNDACHEESVRSQQDEGQLLEGSSNCRLTQRAVTAFRMVAVERNLMSFLTYYNSI
jgi:hypothetical protein